MVPFDRPHTTSYSTSKATIASTYPIPFRRSGVTKKMRIQSTKKLVAMAMSLEGSKKITSDRSSRPKFHQVQTCKFREDRSRGCWVYTVTVLTEISRPKNLNKKFRKKHYPSSPALRAEWVGKQYSHLLQRDYAAFDVIRIKQMIAYTSRQRRHNGV